MRRVRILLAAAAVVVVLAILVAYVVSIPRPTTTSPGVDLEPYLGNLDWPVAMGFAPDGRLFFAERNTGNIRIIRDGVLLPVAFYALSNTPTAGEQGLLGLALHPDFPTEPWVYAYHTFDDPASGVYNRIVRIRADGDGGTALEVVLDRITASTIHNAGVIAFGPDGKLYAPLGDAASPSLAQDLGSINGKVVRMNPDGSVPPDNPFVGDAGGDAYVYTYGHRNMFGIAFHPDTGRVYITENGPTCNDEVNLLEPGGNFGWGPSQTCSQPPPAPENTNQDGPDVVLPLRWYGSVIAPTNAAFYTGSVFPALRNHLIFGDWLDGRLHDLRLDSGGSSVLNESILATVPEGVLDVEIGPDGLIWFTTPSTIYRLVPAQIPADGSGPPVDLRARDARIETSWPPPRKV